MKVENINPICWKHKKRMEFRHLTGYYCPECEEEKLKEQEK